MAREAKVQISAFVERENKEYLLEMADKLGLRGYGEALREIVELGIEAHRAQRVTVDA